MDRHKKPVRETAMDIVFIASSAKYAVFETAGLYL